MRVVRSTGAANAIGVSRSTLDRGGHFGQARRTLAKTGIVTIGMIAARSLGGLLVAACVLVASASSAQTVTDSDTERSRRAYALAGDMMSPFCPGRTLADCPSPNAAAWREEIRLWVDAGTPDAVIRARLQARMPGTDLAAGPRGPLGWALPGLILLAGLGILVAALRRVTRAAWEPDLDPELEAELLRELRD